MKRAELPLILQNEIAECGHACVAMISNFWGHAMTLETIRSFHEPSNKGINLSQIKTLFERLGFTTRALKLSLKELKYLKTPAILHWDLNHFVVLKKIRRNYVIIHDPAIGIRQCDMKELSNSFTGIVLEIEKASEFESLKNKNKNKNKLRLLNLFKAAKGLNKYLAVLMLLSLSIEIFNLSHPLLAQYITDYAILNQDMNNLFTIALAFVLLTLLHTLSEYIRGNMVIYMTNHLNEQFASYVVQHILKLPLHFFEKRHKGDIQSKFQSIDQIQKKISTDFVNTLLDGMMILINLIVMFIYSQLLTFLVMLILFIDLVVRYASYHIVEKETMFCVHQQAKAMSVFLESLQAIASIKSFLKENIRFNTWRNAYIQALNGQIKVSKMNVIYAGLSQMLSNLGYILIVCAGANLVLTNRFSVGMLIAFLSYRASLMTKSLSFFHNLFDYRLISIQLERLSDILSHPIESINTGQGSALHFQGRLAIHNLSFKYNLNEDYIFKNINLTIEAGEKLAIIGPSGCGKTTLLKILMGLLSQTEGHIFIDELPMKEFGLKNYRELTACVMQEDTLVSGSILDNISFFDEFLELENVYHAAKLACIHEVIMTFPMAYETLVGDMGSTLSGGQKQRILLARALYRKPKILFLDEATSHLDIDNERDINHSLKSLHLTQIIVAHRPETIKMADRVINLADLGES